MTTNQTGLTGEVAESDGESDEDESELDPIIVARPNDRDDGAELLDDDDYVSDPQW